MPVKRPIIVQDDMILTGFKEAEWEKLLRTVPADILCPRVFVASIVRLAEAGGLPRSQTNWGDAAQAPYLSGRGRPVWRPVAFLRYARSGDFSLENGTNIVGSVALDAPKNIKTSSHSGLARNPPDGW